ncbi:MAG: amino acid carrier protein [Clostridia bacterium]|nr:amino acid carrier protein [Clostridia bacterium]
MESVNQMLSGVVVPLLLAAAGLYFLCAVGWQIAGHPRRALYGMLGAGTGQGTSPLRALSVALAGTLGVGNIAGVASAIALGGAGAVFWMWISALLAMLLKYAEIVLAVRYRIFDAVGTPHGGAMYYIRAIFHGRLGYALAAAFAVLCLALALTLGGVVQTHAAAEVLEGVFCVPRLAVGAVFAVLAAWTLWRGAARVEATCARLVPLVCLLFSVASLAVLVARRAALPAAFSSIFADAFTVQSGAAGVFGFFTSRALRFGVARGLVSNEAGCGTAPIAHAAAEVKSPAQQGFWGIFEVFVDTVLLCTMTALVILVSGVPITDGGVMLAVSAYASVLGRVAAPMLALSITFFAFATVLCWSHYGGECLAYLAGKRAAARYLIPVMALAVLGGALAAPDLVWGTTDLVIGAMTVLNLAALLAARRTVVSQTRCFFEAK